MFTSIWGMTYATMHYPYQSYLRLSLRHGLSRNPEGFDVHFYMGQDLRHDAVDSSTPLRRVYLERSRKAQNDRRITLCLCVSQLSN